MSSLSYADQHLAWKQRVGKEIFSASKFNEQILLSTANWASTWNPAMFNTANYIGEDNSFYSTKQQYKSKARNNSDSLYQTKRYQDVANYNKYKEVRGKYARPPPPLNLLSKAQWVNQETQKDLAQARRFGSGPVSQNFTKQPSSGHNKTRHSIQAHPLHPPPLSRARTQSAQSRRYRTLTRSLEKQVKNEIMVIYKQRRMKAEELVTKLTKG